MKYLKEWTLIEYYDFRCSLRGQGKRVGYMVTGAMFDRSSARLIKLEIKWGNYPEFTEEERALFLSCSSLSRLNFDKVMMKTGNLQEALTEMAKCEYKLLEK